MMMMMNRKLKRTLPYLQILKTVKDSDKKRMLRSLPTFVLDDIVEILYNILSENITSRSPNLRNFLESKRNTLNNIYKVARNPSKRKQIILKQKGGVIGAMVPIIASTLGGLVGTAL